MPNPQAAPSPHSERAIIGSLATMSSNERTAGSVPSMNDVVGDVLGVRVVGHHRVSGGDVAESFRLTLADGRDVFAKTHRSAPHGFFTTEAAGLEWLRDADAVRVPEVLAVSDGGAGQPPYLVLEWIDQARAPGSTRTDAAFGRRLARLHCAGAPCFGRVDRRTTGSRALPNDPCDTWAEFYRTCRLEPLTRLAADVDALPPDTIRLLERLSARLDELGGPPELPARLHGDLWAGNRLVDRDGDSWLIDPAAHGGHREFDLAMMRLFGGYGDACFGAYHDAYPLADGWRERIPLQQVAPLTVHAIKFGGGYATATEHALTSALSR